MCRTSLFTTSAKVWASSLEVSGHLNLTMVQEACHNQRDEPVHGHSITDQPFPGWMFAAHEEVTEFLIDGVRRTRDISGTSRHGW